jgi:hypothetical protein
MLGERLYLGSFTRAEDFERELAQDVGARRAAELKAVLSGDRRTSGVREAFSRGAASRNWPIRRWAEELRPALVAWYVEQTSDAASLGRRLDRLSR